MIRHVIADALEALEGGRLPSISADDFPCFSTEAARFRNRLGPAALERIVASLSVDDVPTLKRALDAIDAHESAWLGFKVVYDGEAALANIDEGPAKKFGNVGSADGQDAMFFCNDAGEVVSAREPSARDIFQMKDITRGPGMHADQFAGLTWTSVALIDSPTVWLLGASDLAAEVAHLAARVGFSTFAVDDDESFLKEARFPSSTRVLLASWDELDTLHAHVGDYACVLTNGHVHDVEACLWAAKQPLHYAGMLGSDAKNQAVAARCFAAGMTDEAWESIKRPIGLSFGAKTSAEIALAIVAELVDVRYKQRYSEDERNVHDVNLGRMKE